MAVVNIEKYRRRVLEEKAHLEGLQHRLHSDDAESMQEPTGEVTSDDRNHPADEGAEMFEHERDSALDEGLNAQLAQVHDALERLDAGTYGTCERCGKPIGEARLDELPFATLCIECQTLIERGE
jgi:RNA polymerase-binding transcription factor DksA